VLGTSEIISTNYLLPTTNYELGGFNPHQRSAKRQRALAQLPTISYQLPPAACGTKTPLFAAFAVLKTRALYVILSLSQNIRSVLTRTHHERSFDHVGRNQRTQAERQQVASAPCRTHRCAASTA